jgi:hypothetical protein
VLIGLSSIAAYGWLVPRIALMTAGVLAVLAGAFPVAANAAFAPAKGSHGHGGGGGGSAICGSGTTSNCGFDVSYPQCGSTFPAPTAFAIVGVNGGLANDYNSCLQGELSWASGSSGATSQPPVSLYVNTADPGNMYNGRPIADWPTSGATPYGGCVTTTATVRVRGHTTSYTVGENSAACAWQYGYDMVQGSLGSANEGNVIVAGDVSQVASPATYTWWLDVETANSWQADTTMNVADLEGMVAGFQKASVTSVGIYSTSPQWGTIAGGTPATTSSLYGTPNWIPGATSESGAKSNCSLPSFTGGSVTLTQWTGTFDSDYACGSA